MDSDSPHQPEHLGSRTGRRLGYAILAYLIAVTMLITWAPFRFSSHLVHGLTDEWSWSDLLLNVVMFMPLGFFWKSARARTPVLPWWFGAVIGLLLSSVIEVGQLFLVERYTSLLDVITNALGAAIGSYLFEKMRPRVYLGANAVSALALEVPLMGLVILLLPLLWVSGFASVGSSRGWLTLLIALFGGAVIGAVHGAYLHHTGRVSRPALLMATALWFVVASLPGSVREPWVIAVGSLLAVSAAWFRSHASARARAMYGAHRVELPTLRLVLPFFAAYLTLSALWPVDAFDGVWRYGWALSPATTELTRALLMQSLEYLAAFTLVGYITAEYHGRENAPFAQSWQRVVLGACALLGLLEFARGWNSTIGASGSLALLSLGSALFGGWLYHLQRDHVRTLLARPMASIIRPRESALAEQRVA